MVLKRLFFVIVALGLLVLVFSLKSGERKTPSKPGGRTTDAVYVSPNDVPPITLMPQNHRFEGAQPPKDVVSRSQTIEALKLIRSLRTSLFLQNPRDLEIGKLIDEILDGTARFELQHGSVEAPGTSVGTRSRMAYSCARDVYLVDPELRTPTVFLAVSVYHELDHAVQCRKRMAELGMTRHEDMQDEMRRQANQEPCIQEGKSSYAAQVRLFAAITTAGMLPHQVSSGDTGLLMQTVDVWQALLERRFCQWYKDTLAGHHAPPAIEKVE